MRRNILISTTRQWNPGDEFIMLGCIEIIKRKFGNNNNFIIYNRNPDIRGGASFRNNSRNYKFTFNWDSRSFRGKGGLHEIFRIGHFDNSWKDDMDPSNIDLAVFAGSPEWYGTRLRSMYDAIYNNDIPTYFFGLGAGDSVDFKKSHPVVDKVLKKAIVITTRDKATNELLKEYNSIYLPCPALFAADRERLVTKVSKIGLIYATNETLKGNNVSKTMHDYIIKLYHDLAKSYKVSLICHYIDEIDLAKRELPEIDVFYSYDSKDYRDIYDSFDLVIGGRVHGIGMAASLGIPGIMIKHDARSSTTDGFLADSINIGLSTDEVVSKIEEISSHVAEYSSKLIKHKESTMKNYLALVDDRDLNE